MPVPTDIDDLSQTAGSNSPAGSESPTTTDDYLRAQAAFIAQLRDGVGFSATSNMVVGRTYAEYTSNANLTTTIPGDDTIPQNTEGTEIISVSYTPKSTTNRLRLRFRGEAAASAIVSVGAALFSSASASALRATLVNLPTAGQIVTLGLEHEYVPGTTSALTFSIRVGPTSAATVRMNGTNAARFYGGSMAATLVIEEIAA